MYSYDMWGKYDENITDEEDVFLKKTFEELKRKGGIYDHKNKKERIYGLGTWLTKDLNRSEHFIFTCYKLYHNFKAALRKIHYLKEQIKKLTGVSEMVNLSSQYQLHTYFNIYDVKEVMVPKEQAEILIKAINESIEKCLKYGFNNGSNLLKRLSDGDMTVLSFEKERDKNQ